MSIYYGSKKVKIIKDLDGGEVRVQYDDLIMDVPIIELEADGGVTEVHDTIHELKMNK
jgi:hypothetical protein